MDNDQPTCAFKPTKWLEPCGQPATAMCYSGSIEFLEDRNFRPYCSKHQEMTGSCHYAEAVPLSDGATWVVALRAIRVAVTA